MRSHVVHLAKLQVPNRFELIHMAAKITRAFHRPASQCVSTSITESLEMIAGEKTFILSAEKQTEQAVAGMGLVPQVLAAESSEAVS